MSAILTSADYVEQSGNVCPFCGGGAVQTTSLISLTMIGVDLEVECLDCETKYMENYKLVGYEKDRPVAKEI